MWPQGPLIVSHQLLRQPVMMVSGVGAPPLDLLPFVFIFMWSLLLIFIVFKYVKKLDMKVSNLMGNNV